MQFNFIQVNAHTYRKYVQMVLTTAFFRFKREVSFTAQMESSSCLINHKSVKAKCKT